MSETTKSRGGVDVDAVLGGVGDPVAGDRHLPGRVQHDDSLRHLETIEDVPSDGALSPPAMSMQWLPWPRIVLPVTETNFGELVVAADRDDTDDGVAGLRGPVGLLRPPVESSMPRPVRDCPLLVLFSRDGYLQPAG